MAGRCRGKIEKGPVTSRPEVQRRIAINRLAGTLSSTAPFPAESPDPELLESRAGTACGEDRSFATQAILLIPGLRATRALLPRLGLQHPDYARDTGRRYRRCGWHLD
jgi:hypothetical protein